MPRINVVRLFLIIVLTLATHELSASTGVTNVVGSCKPTLPSFTTISAALAATPAPNIVIVCPGTYPEQVVITQPVTLEGVSSANSNQPIIAVPSGGAVANASVFDSFGDLTPAAAQLWVNNAAGPVTVTDITIDGSGNGVPQGTSIIGILYQNSPGTINRVATRNQFATSIAQGVGIWLEGGASNPTVTVENSSIHDFDRWGIKVNGVQGPSQLTATINANDVDPKTGSFAVGISTFFGTTFAITGNFVTGAFTGIEGVSTGSIANNILINNSTGIATDVDNVVSITGNKIRDGGSGILLQAAGSPIKSNTITHTSVGIEFNCFADTNVHSNTISDSGTAVDNIPSGTATSNSYFNVATIRSSCP